MVGIQAFINLGSISGILPITGVTLPFVSYGGTSLLVLLIAMGVLNNVAMSTRKRELETTDPDEMSPSYLNKYRIGANDGKVKSY